MVKLEVANADGSSHDDIFTTMDHPFYVEGRGWIMVKNLNAGDELVSDHDTSGAVFIKAITSEGYSATTSNHFNHKRYEILDKDLNKNV